MASADPTASIIFFLILTLAYSIFKYYTKSPSMLKIWTGIYFLVLIIVQFFINLGLTNEICGFTQYNTALTTTLVPWLFIFGLLNLFLMEFPSWLSPFSNTIGYVVLNGLGKLIIGKGIGDALIAILKKDNTNKLLKKVYADPSMMVNDITPDNFNSYDRNRYIQSKGHSVEALYTVLCEQ